MIYNFSEKFLNNKRYYTWDNHLKNKFNKKVFKVPLNAGFTCPNIDGTKGYGGCTYCSPKGSGDFTLYNEKNLLSQFYNLKEDLHKKWPDAKYIAYFQSFTNTYGNIDDLKKKYELFLDVENVVGISIATRADCITDEISDYLYELSKKTYLVVELGLQTIHDDTAKIINRCHGYNEFLIGYEKLIIKGINVCIHIINGLPGENKEMMIDTVKEISKLEIHSIKIHLLHVLKRTVLEYQYNKGMFRTLDLDEYVDIVCDQIEILPPNVIIQRLTGDGLKDDLIAPLWSLKKFVVINEIDKELRRRNSYQGIKF